MAVQRVELFQEITVGNTEDQVILNDYRDVVYLVLSPGNSGTIQFAVSPSATIGSGKAMAAGDQVPFTLQPGQQLRAIGSAAGQKFMITG